MSVDDLVDKKWNETRPEKYIRKSRTHFEECPCSLTFFALNDVVLDALQVRSYVSPVLPGVWEGGAPPGGKISPLLFF